MNILSRKDFPKLISSFGYTGTGMEIGVAVGQFSEVLITSQLSKIYLLDCWWPRNINRKKFQTLKNPEFNFDTADNEWFLGNVLGKFWDIKKVVVIKGFSEIVFEDFADNSFDFIYIDADHSYEGVKRDITNWWPKIRPGGMLAGHDYYIEGYAPESHIEWMGEVKQAVDEFIEEKKLKLEVIREMWPSWWTLKPI